MTTRDEIRTMILEGKRPDRFRDDAPPHAEVTRGGRWTWYIRVCHGSMQWGPDGGPFIHTGTEAGANAKAERLLRKYARKEGLRQERRIVNLSDGDVRVLDLQREKAIALAELRDPVSAWERAFAATSAPARGIRRLFERRRS